MVNRLILKSLNDIEKFIEEQQYARALVHLKNIKAVLRTEDETKKELSKCPVRGRYCIYAEFKCTVPEEDKDNCR